MSPITESIIAINSSLLDIQRNNNGAAIEKLHIVLEKLARLQDDTLASNLVRSADDIRAKMEKADAS